MVARVRLGQRYRDLDPRRADREGVVVEIHRDTVRLQWRSGYATVVRRSRLDVVGTRGYVLVDDPSGMVVPKAPRIRLPNLAADCRVGNDAKGRRLWKCHVCGREGRLSPPWRVLLWSFGRGQHRSTIVCSDSCHETVRKVRHERCA